MSLKTSQLKAIFAYPAVEKVCFNTSNYYHNGSREDFDSLSLSVYLKDTYIPVHVHGFTCTVDKMVSEAISMIEVKLAAVPDVCECCGRTK